MRAAVCEWFALCTNPAAGTTPHPILGDVPICERCAARFDLPHHHRGEPMIYVCDYRSPSGRRTCKRPAQFYVTGGTWTSAACHGHLGGITAWRVENHLTQALEAFGPVTVSLIPATTEEAR